MSTTAFLNWIMMDTTSHTLPNLKAPLKLGGNCIGSTELVDLALLESGFLMALFSFTFIGATLRLPLHGLPGATPCNRRANVTSVPGQVVCIWLPFSFRNNTVYAASSWLSGQFIVFCSNRLCYQYHPIIWQVSWSLTYPALVVCVHYKHNINNIEYHSQRITH